MLSVSLENKIAMKNFQKSENKNPFEVPKKFFHNFATELETKISEQTIREICGNKNPFSVPATYFSTFSVSKTSLVSKINLNYILPIFIAASLLLFFGLRPITTNSTKSNKHKIVKTDLQPDDIFMAEVENYDTQTFYDYVIESTEEENKNTTISQENKIEIEYLIDNSDDLTLADAY